jgi:hypothetical protein
VSRARSFWLPIAAVAYVCFAALQAGGGTAAILALIGLPLLLAEVWRRSAVPRHAEDRIEPAARSALRAAFFGTALWVAARTGAAGRPTFDAAANFGAGTAAVAALVAMARIGTLGGVLSPHPATRSLDAAAFVGLLWGIAVAVPATAIMLPPQHVELDPLAIDYATTSAAIGSLLVLVAASWRMRVLRRLEIGVADRAAGALALALTALSVAVPAALFNVAPPDRVVPVAVVLAALACTWTAVTPEPTTVSSALRGILAVMILGAPTTLAAGLLAREAPHHAGAIVLGACVLSIVVGLIARAVARPLGPEQSRWLDAIEAASRGALQPEPDAAIRASLMALSRAASTPGARPELWRNDPEEVLSVDLAGYLHVDKAQAPAALYELAAGEPERTLRAEVLRELEVRRPDLRPVLAWFDNRRAFSATLVLDEDGPLGFILLPRDNRRSAMTLEEARAVRNLADRISALLSVSSALARSRERELAAVARADKTDEERQRLERVILADTGRNEAAAERAARAVRATAYGPAARMAIESLERFGPLGSLRLLVPPGVEPLGWAAIAHLASPRRGGPLIEADGAGSAERDITLWEDAERSPLRLADGGTLLLRDASALPPDVEECIARLLARRASSQRSAIPAPEIFAAFSPAKPKLRPGRPLERQLAERSVAIPPLADRAEDLRALVLDRLSRAGLRLRDEPLGIDAGALRLLSEHTWPGNEAELDDLILRAAEVTSGPVVTAADLATVGFRPIFEAAAQATPLPVLTRRRPPSRPPRRR